jgi:hypothetical protein
MRLNLFALLLSTTLLQGGDRVILSLDGQWDITDSKAADGIPSSFGAQGPGAGPGALFDPGLSQRRSV